MNLECFVAMLTPSQAILSAVLTAVIVEFLSRRYGSSLFGLEVFDENIIDNGHELRTELPSIEIENGFSLEKVDGEMIQEPEELNKLIDAIFVSHGVGIIDGKEESPSSEQAEDYKDTEVQSVGDDQMDPVSKSQVDPLELVDTIKEVDPLNQLDTVSNNSNQSDPIVKSVLNLDESNFSKIYTGNWLILAHFPFYPPSSTYLSHFLQDYPTALNSNSVSLATLDCYEYPKLTAVLNVKRYPSLVLVVEDGKLMDWPFKLRKLDQQASWFISTSQWKHLPVYQLLQQVDDILIINSLQIQVFNRVFKFIVSFTFKNNIKIDLFS